jgi:hypothetical protein
MRTSGPHKVILVTPRCSMREGRAYEQVSFTFLRQDGGMVVQSPEETLRQSLPSMLIG